MSLGPIFEKRLAEAETALEKLTMRRSEFKENRDGGELDRVVVLRREELALLRKLRPSVS
jgi:hypothetical protein